MKLIYTHKHKNYIYSPQDRFFECPCCCVSEEEKNYRGKQEWKRQSKELKYIDYDRQRYRY